jgi:hypothetical protein
LQREIIGGLARALPARGYGPADRTLIAPLLVRSVCGLPLSPPLALRRLVGRRRRPKPGAEALVGLFAVDEHPPGTPTPSLLFPSLQAEHRNPNLKLFSYLTNLLTSKFLQKLLGVHVYTHVPLLDPPLLAIMILFEDGMGIFHYGLFMVHVLTCALIYLQLEGAGKMIGVGKAKQYANVLDKPLSRGKQEVFPSDLCAHCLPRLVLEMSIFFFFCHASHRAGMAIPSSSLLPHRLL